MRKELNKVAALLTCVGIALHANAEPPPGSSGKYHAYYEGLKVPGHPTWDCCGAPDCREVKAEFRDGMWWAMATKEVFGEHSGAPDDWVPIPNHIIITDPPDAPRPPGLTATLCWYARAPYCFNLPETGG